MAETQSPPSAATARHDQSTGGAIAVKTPLVTDTGSTTIADGVVGKVAGIAAREVPGVYDLGGGAARAVGNVTSRVGIGQLAQGVSVEVGTREAAVDLVVVVEYGESIPQVSDAIRQNVIKRIHGITGLTVTEVNINVTDLHFAGEDSSDEPAESRVQ